MSMTIKQWKQQYWAKWLKSGRRYIISDKEIRVEKTGSFINEIIFK